jgi:hypothetical protein
VFQCCLWCQDQTMHRCSLLVKMQPEELWAQE